MRLDGKTPAALLELAAVLDLKAMVVTKKCKSCNKDRLKATASNCIYEKQRQVASFTGTVASHNVPEASNATPDQDGNLGGYEEPR